MFFNPEVFGDALHKEYNTFPARRFSRVITPMDTSRNHKIPNVVKPSAVPKEDNTVRDIEELVNDIKEEYNENLMRQYAAKYSSMSLESLYKLKGEKEEMYKIMESSATYGVVSSNVREETYDLNLELKVINKQIELLEREGNILPNKLSDKTVNMAHVNGTNTENGGGDWISTRRKSITKEKEVPSHKEENDVMDFLNDDDYTPPNHQPSLSDVEAENGEYMEEERDVPEYFDVMLVDNYIKYCLRKKWSSAFQKSVEDLPESFTHESIREWSTNKMYDRCNTVRSLLLVAKVDTVMDELLDQVGILMRSFSVKLTYLEEIFGSLRLVETYAIEWSKGSRSERNKRSVITGLDMKDEDIVTLTLKNSSSSGKSLNYIFERDFVPLINAYYRVCHFPSLVIFLFEKWSDEKNEQREDRAFGMFSEEKRENITSLLNKMCFVIQDMLERMTGKEMTRWFDDA